MKTILFISLFACSTVFADLDAASQEALKNTQNALEDSGTRNKIINENKELKAMDNKIDGFAGQDKEKIYDLSSQIMKNLAEKGNGDPEKMKAVLDEAQNNPDKFFKEYFNAEQQKAVRDVANDIEKKNQPPSDNSKK